MGNLLTTTKPHQHVAGQVLPEDPGEELAGMEGLPEGAEAATATATSRAGLNPRRATFLKMSDMVGTVLSQKPRRLQRFRNESSFARSDAEQRPEAYLVQ